MAWLTDRIAEFNAILADYVTVPPESVDELNGRIAAFIEAELAAADTSESVAGFLGAHMTELRNDLDNRTFAQLGDFSAATAISPNGLPQWLQTDLGTLTDIYDDYAGVPSGLQSAADNRFAHWILRMLCSAAVASDGVATYIGRLTDLKAMLDLRLQQEIDNFGLVITVS